MADDLTCYYAMQLYSAEKPARATAATAAEQRTGSSSNAGSGATDLRQEPANVAANGKTTSCNGGPQDQAGTPPSNFPSELLRSYITSKVSDFFLMSYPRKVTSFFLFPSL